MPFVVVEGIDGAGKSLLLSQLVGWAAAAGREVVALREPGSTALGEGVRRILLDPDTGDLTPWTEAALFTAARAELVQTVVRPALARGATVFLDRYYHSTLAYQGFGDGLDVGLLQAVSEAAVQGLRPDRVIVLDLPVSVARERRRRGADRLEQRDEGFFERVRAGYLTLARRDPLRIGVVDATQPPSDVLAEVCRQLDPVLGELR